MNATVNRENISAEVWYDLLPFAWWRQEAEPFTRREGEAETRSGALQLLRRSGGPSIALRFSGRSGLVAPEKENERKMEKGIFSRGNFVEGEGERVPQPAGIFVST